MAPNGIYGLFSLNGAPIDPRDWQRLLGPLEDEALAVPGALVAVREQAGGAVDIHRDGADLAILLGGLDEAGDVAGRLGMAANAPPAALAAAALARWQGETPAMLAGEWLLLHWQAQPATLRVVMAQGAYETCHVATDGRRIAIAPDLLSLTRLPWVDVAFAPEVVMATMGRAYLRTAIGPRTILKGVTRARPGTVIRMAADGVHHAAPAPVPPPPLAAIGFDEGMAAIDTLLRGIVRRRLAGAGGIAVQMSGGLDSALMGVLAAAERQPGQPLVFLTSAARSGSGITDESDWAAMVARHLDVPMIPVVPDSEAEVYRPSARWFAGYPSPSPSSRHYLYRALADAAVAAGAQRMIDGSFGEATVSNHGYSLASHRQRSWHGLARNLRDTWHRRTEATRTGDYHVMPARDRARDHAGLRALRPRAYAPRRVEDDAAFGFEDGMEKLGELSTYAGDPRLRELFPLRDPRLVRLMAACPARFVRHGGIDRAPARALLRGHLPEAVVMRPKGLAFSPGHVAMLYDQATSALAHLSEQRRAGAGEWLDLDWLEVMLGRIRDGARLPFETLDRIQGTAYAAEFFRWWHAAIRTG